MIYWHPCKIDCSGSQNLLGVVISICQSLMSEFNPTIRQDEFLSAGQRSVWRRLWWACVLYDGWTSIAAGRVSKINHFIDRIPIPLSEDIIQELRELPLSLQQQYVPPESDQLVRYYVNHLEIGAFVGRVFSDAEKIDGNIPTVDDINRWEANLKNIERATSQMVAEGTRSTSDITKLAAYHFQICYA